MTIDTHIKGTAPHSTYAVSPQTAAIVDYEFRETSGYLHTTVG